MSIKVSVCCITYNHENYIEQAIQGFLMQEADFEIEIVIADDASTDNTALIIQKYAEQHPHKIQFIRHKANVGMMPNFKLALQTCKGEYVAICEGDDYWTDKAKLKKQVAELDSHPDASICFHRVNMVNNKGEILSLSTSFGNKQEFTTANLIEGEWVAMTCSIMFRKKHMPFPDWFTKIVNGDYALQLLCSLNGNIIYLNEIMGAYRQHATGYSQLYITAESNFQKLSLLFNYFNHFSNFRYKKIISKKKKLMQDQLAEKYIIETSKHKYFSEEYINHYKNFMRYFRLSTKHLKSAIRLLLPPRLYNIYRRR